MNNQDINGYVYNNDVWYDVEMMNGDVIDVIGDDFFNLGQNSTKENGDDNVDGNGNKGDVDDVMLMSIAMQAVVDPFKETESTFDANIGILDDGLFFDAENNNVHSQRHHSMEMESNIPASSFIVDCNGDKKVKESSMKKKYKCQCGDHSQQNTININIHSKIIGCLDCGKVKLVIEKHQKFFNYLVDIGKRKELLKEIEIGLKFRKEGEHFKSIIESGDLHKLLNVNVFQNFFTLCKIEGITGKETFANKIKRNEEFLPFTSDELSNMEIVGSPFILTRISKKRGTLDGVENNSKDGKNKKARKGKY